ncbi:MAG: MHYT domain-containing protein [Pseudomonadota bacterium]|nr:MHYT domain-containing protein [Pseudomonadota bacterium]
MIRILDCVVEQHDLWLVGLAAVVCLLASHTALSLHRRGLTDSDHARYWTFAAALAMGTGVWATHFVAMLAYRVPWALGYDTLDTLLSALIAVVMSWGGLLLVRHGRHTLGAVVCGSAIGCMHYMGMAGLTGPFTITWDALYVGLSVVFGIAFTVLAFNIPRRVHGIAGTICVVSFYALAVCSLHFTAMSAATMSYDLTGDSAGLPGIERQTLAIGIAAITILLLALGLIGAIADSYLADRNAMEAARLRLHIAELERTRAELSNALEAAAASSNAKSQFLATMSHELRTPLNAILGFSDIMVSGLFGPLGNPTYEGYAADIRNSGRHLLNMINDILDFSKIEAGRMELNEDETDLGDVMREAVRLVRGQADEAQIQLRTDLDAEVPPILADHRRLKQIALNLLSNAIKFTRAGGTVTASVGMDAEQVWMRITDTGIGMKAEHIPLAMEAFGQVEGSHSREFGGTGLGLPLCRSLAELHDGTLTVESERNRGTVVTVFLPRSRIVRDIAAA